MPKIPTKEEQEMTEKDFVQKLIEVQMELKAPKDTKNEFGGFKYRSAEQIEALVKPLLAERGLLLFLSDEFVPLEGHDDPGHIKATATVGDGIKNVQVSAYARESAVKKGMDASQITGSASSYARKYALCGLFLIDDTKDADTQDNSQDSRITHDALVATVEQIKGMNFTPEQTKEFKGWLETKGFSLGKLNAKSGRYTGWNIEPDQLEEIYKAMSAIKEPIE